MNSIKKYIAEVIGTFVLVTFGCGTAVAVGCDHWFGCGYILTALAFGLVIVAMAYSIGNISGCHINPAVSLAMLIRKQLSVTDFVGYVISQLIGSTLGCVVLGILFGFDCGFGANQIQDGWENGSVGAALLAEVVLTFVFVLAIIGVTSKTENTAVSGVVIGLTLTLVHILGIALTGTSVNPARSLMPAIFAGGDALSQVWIFIVAPLVGGALAALCYGFLEKKDEDKAE
ncbi:MAG: aquaporin [Ruminococcus sp.]|nr:aquaporin [Ruminococcus sp.]